MAATFPSLGTCDDPATIRWFIRTTLNDRTGDAVLFSNTVNRTAQLIHDLAIIRGHVRDAVHEFEEVMAKAKLGDVPLELRTAPVRPRVLRSQRPAGRPVHGRRGHDHW